MPYQIEQYKITGELPAEIEFGAWRPKHPEEHVHPNHVNKTPEGRELVPVRIYRPRFEPTSGKDPGREIVIFKSTPQGR